MTKKIILFGIATIVTFGGIYLVAAQSGLFNNEPVSSVSISTSNTASESTTNESVASEDDTSPLSGVSTFIELAERGESLRCEYNSYITEDGTETSGVVYLADGKVRVEGEVKQADTTFMTSFIDDTEYLYTWSNGLEGAMAVKMSKDDIDTTSSVSDTGNMYPTQTSGETFDYDEEISYDCQVWTADNSLFVPPADIEFINPNEILESMNFDPKMFQDMVPE